MNITPEGRERRRQGGKKGMAAVLADPEKRRSVWAAAAAARKLNAEKRRKALDFAEKVAESAPADYSLLVDEANSIISS